jgi:uncharacterized protein (UPF0303 family)
MTAIKDKQASVADAQEWARRKKNNVRLAYLMGGIAVAIFLISLWKYRPL